MQVQKAMRGIKVVSSNFSYIPSQYSNARMWKAIPERAKNQFRMLITKVKESRRNIHARPANVIIRNPVIDNAPPTKFGLPSQRRTTVALLSTRYSHWRRLVGNDVPDMISIADMSPGTRSDMVVCRREIDPLMKFAMLTYQWTKQTM